jgi:hypothetical protein
MSREFLKENRDNLFNEIPNLISADFQENPDRIVLTVLKPLDNLPEKEYNGTKVVFEQLVLGGVITQKEESPIVDIDKISHGLFENKDSILEKTLGKECITPHNVKTNNKEALEAWEKRYPAIKVKE